MVRMNSRPWMLAAGLLLATAAPAAAFDTEAAAAKADSHRPAIAHGMRLREVLEKLSPDGRKIMLDSMRAEHDAFLSGNAELRQVRAEIAEAMMAPKLDKDRLRKLFARERKLASEAQARRHERMLESLARLSLADRKVFATMLQRADRFDRRMPPPPGQ